MGFSKQAIRKRQQRLENQLQSNSNAHFDRSSLLIFFSGDPIQRPGGFDQTYTFIPYPEYYWLTGSRRSGGVLTYSLETGWTHFVRPNDYQEQLWEGVLTLPEAIEGNDIQDLGLFSKWLEKYSKESKIIVWGSSTANPYSSPNSGNITQSDEGIRAAIDMERRRKDPEEIALLRFTAKATAAGFAAAKRVIRPGITERDLQIEIESEMFRAGADATGYGSIVGSGTHSAVLHFEPSTKFLQPGELVLIDAGAAKEGYCSDVTRVFSVSDSLSQSQRDIYQIVLSAQIAGIEKCKVGTEWHDVHRQSARVITEGLINLGLLSGSVDSLLESGATSVFFPHGVGHMVGLGVRDVGGRSFGRIPRQVYGVNVRVDFSLEEFQVMTVEPGIYFITALLNHRDTREKFKQQIQWNILEKIQKESLMGGIRIEDDVVIGKDKPEILTAEIKK